MTIEEILTQNKVIAVYGMSAKEIKPSHYVPIYMKNNGYEIIPINPVADEIAGMKVFKEIMDVPGEIDILNVFRPSEACLEVVEEAVERHKAKGDIKVIWLQESIMNDEAKALAEANGIEFVQDRCLMKEHGRI